MGAHPGQPPATPAPEKCHFLVTTPWSIAGRFNFFYVGHPVTVRYRGNNGSSAVAGSTIPRSSFLHLVEDVPFMDKHGRTSAPFCEVPVPCEEDPAFGRRPFEQYRIFPGISRGDAVCTGSIVPHEPEYLQRVPGILSARKRPEGALSGDFGNNSDLLPASAAFMIGNIPLQSHAYPDRSIRSSPHPGHDAFVRVVEYIPEIRVM